MTRHAVFALAFVVSGAPALSAHPTAEARFSLTDAQICFSNRDLTATPAADCRAVKFPVATARVVAVDTATHVVTLEHATLPGVNAAGTHTYHIDPAYLVEALATGDAVQVTFESRHGNIVDIFPLLKD